MGQPSGSGASSTEQRLRWLVGRLHGDAQGFVRGSIGLRRVGTMAAMCSREGVPASQVQAILVSCGLVWNPKTGAVTSDRAIRIVDDARPPVVGIQR